MFIKRNGPEILLCLLESLELPNNSLSSLTSIYTTLSLLWLEVNCTDFLPDVLRLTLDMQASFPAGQLLAHGHAVLFPLVVGCCPGTGPHGGSIARGDNRCYQ